MIRLENILKISLQEVLKTSWRCLEDAFARRLEDVLKTSWRHLGKTSWRRLEDVLKTSWRRLEDVWPRRIYWSWSRRLEDVLKTSSEDVWVRRIYSSWSRHLLKAKTKGIFKPSSRRLHEDKCLMGAIILMIHIQNYGSLMLLKTEMSKYLIYCQELMKQDI